jgi:hypothetical protein
MITTYCQSYAIKLPTAPHLLANALQHAHQRVNGEFSTL